MIRKKKAAKKKASAAPKQALQSIYYRACSGAPQDLYKVDAIELVKAAGGGLDLSEVPPGYVFKWDREKAGWVKAVLPEVGHEAHCVRHTKNAARIGV